MLVARGMIFFCFLLFSNQRGDSRTIWLFVSQRLFWVARNDTI